MACLLPFHMVVCMAGPVDTFGTWFCLAHSNPQTLFVIKRDSIEIGPPPFWRHGNREAFHKWLTKNVWRRVKDMPLWHISSIEEGKTNPLWNAPSLEEGKNSLLWEIFTLNSDIVHGFLQGISFIGKKSPSTNSISNPFHCFQKCIQTDYSKTQTQYRLQFEENTDRIQSSPS